MGLLLKFNQLWIGSGREVTCFKTQVGQKMDKAKVKRIAVSTAAIASFFLSASVANAQNDERLKNIVKEVNQSTQIAQASQKKVDSISDATAKLFLEYKGVLKTNAGLRAYNAQQRRVIKRQEEEIIKITKSPAGFRCKIKRYSHRLNIFPGVPFVHSIKWWGLVSISSKAHRCFKIIRRTISTRQSW